MHIIHVNYKKQHNFPKQLQCINIYNVSQKKDTTQPLMIISTIVPVIFGTNIAE